VLVNQGFQTVYTDPVISEVAVEFATFRKNSSVKNIQQNANTPRKRGILCGVTLNVVLLNDHVCRRNITGHDDATESHL